MKKTGILGIAFLFQFATSLLGNAVFKAKTIFPGAIEKTLSTIRSDSFSMVAYIALSVATALGVAFLGYMLYLHLRHINRKATAIAFALYVAEAISLLISLVFTHKLVIIANSATDIENSIALASESMACAEMLSGKIHMLLFCLGAIVFYAYMLKGKLICKYIPLWGLVSVSFLFCFTLLSFASIAVPFAFYLPYVPFELVIGIAFIAKKSSHSSNAA